MLEVKSCVKLLVGAMVTWTALSAVSSATESRDWFKRSDPVVEKLWALLQIKPLPRKAGRSTLRVWDSGANMTLGVEGDTVTLDAVWSNSPGWWSIVNEYGGLGKRAKEAEQDLKAKSDQLKVKDSRMARDLEYLIRRISEFDTTNRPFPDAGETYIDAVDAKGGVTSFDMWGPRQDKDPFAFDLCHLFDTFTYCIRIVEKPEGDWLSHEKLNFMNRLGTATGVNLTQRRARVVLINALSSRIQALVAELKRT